jgi:hypothetical protein
MTEVDPLNLDELIRQAREQKARWRPPDPDTVPHPSDKGWQEIMDNRFVRDGGRPK